MAPWSTSSSAPRAACQCTLTQAEPPAIMGVRQASISKLENQHDMQLATLRRLRRSAWRRARDPDAVPGGGHRRRLVAPRHRGAGDQEPAARSGAAGRRLPRAAELTTSCLGTRRRQRSALRCCRVVPTRGHHDGCHVPSPSSTAPHRRPWRTSCAASFAEMRASLGRAVCRGRCVPGSVNGLRRANAHVRFVCVGGCGIGATR